MASRYISLKDQPELDEILAALRKALDDNPHLVEMPEEVARQLVIEGHLEKGPSPSLMAEVLQAIETEEENPT